MTVWVLVGNESVWVSGDFKPFDANSGELADFEVHEAEHIGLGGKRTQLCLATTRLLHPEFDGRVVTAACEKYASQAVSQ